MFDNGSGITRDDLEKIGSRYVTNKYHNLDELGKFHGFRGEALASLRHISSVLQITSRIEETYISLFVRGKRKPLEKAVKPRECRGSTVILRDVFFNFPVRYVVFTHGVILLHIPAIHSGRAQSGLS